MVNVVIFTADTYPIGDIPTPKLPFISQDPDFYKGYFSGLVEMTLDDITWKRILSMDVRELPHFIQELLSQHNKRVTKVINTPQILLAA